ncbi:hypothetical protein FHG87_004084 [Trinorchestia longiramus]|nr:hypothetical protein FHG87_004084 [Trinorchestia longiramus]
MDGVKRRRSEEEENIGLSPNKIVRTSPRSPCKSTSNRINTRLCPRKSYIGLSLSTVALPKVHYTDPEDIIIEKENEKMLERQKQMRPKRLVIKKDTSLENPTPQMLALMAKRREKSLSPPICTKRHKHKFYCYASSSGKASPTFDDPPTDLTPEMEAVIRRKEEREAAERAAREQEQLTSLNQRPPSEHGCSQRGRSRVCSGGAYNLTEDSLGGHSRLQFHQNSGENSQLEDSVLLIPEVSARDRRYLARLQEPVSPTIAVEDLENSNDGYLDDHRSCDGLKTPSALPANSNALKLCRRKGTETAEVNRGNARRRNSVSSQKLSLNHISTFSKEDPYEFIDEIFSESSPKSYKEYSIEHSPVKVKRRICMFRASKLKGQQRLRKSARLCSQISTDFVEPVVA